MKKGMSNYYVLLLRGHIQKINRQQMFLLHLLVTIGRYGERGRPLWNISNYCQMANVLYSTALYCIALHYNWTALYCNVLHCGADNCNTQYTSVTQGRTKARASFDTSLTLVWYSTALFKRPGVAGAVLQTPLLMVN